MSNRMTRYIRARLRSRSAVLVHVAIFMGGFVLLLLASSQTQSFLSNLVYRSDDSPPKTKEQEVTDAEVNSSDGPSADVHVPAENSNNTGRAVCIGSDESRGEIEDILCIPKPKYEDTLKNPCWWDEVLPPTSQPGEPRSALGAPKMSLQCLPYFHILCCSKCATTNLFHRLRLHPQIIPNDGYLGGKELLFWAWAKNGFRGRWEKGTPATFPKYIKRFNTIARYLETELMHKKNAQYITLDGSPGDMWDFRGWPLLPQNRGLREPAVLTPHLMYHMYRDPKFIVLMREPVERLYTAYIFFHPDRNAVQFHRDVIEGIKMMDSCLSTAPSRRECYFNESVVDKLPVDLHYNCYAVFLKEWLSVFPKRHFLFMRTEDYSVNTRASLLKVFDFLKIPPPSKAVMQQMLKIPVTYHTFHKDAAGEMLPETRSLLQKYMQPCNEELAKLIGDDAYLWKNESIPLKP